MGSEPPRLVIVVHPGPRTRSILGWLRRLVPAALLVVAAANLPPPAPPDAIVLDDEEVESGPLSLADALMRHRVATASSSSGTTATGDR
jgi:hypothetical protein